MSYLNLLSSSSGILANVSHPWVLIDNLALREKNLNVGISGEKNYLHLLFSLLV